MIPDGTPTARCSARCAARASSSGSSAKSATAHSAVATATSSAADEETPAPIGSVELTAPSIPTGGRPSSASSASTARTNLPQSASSLVPANASDVSSVRSAATQSMRTPRSSATGSTSPPATSVYSPIRFTRPGAQNERVLSALPPRRLGDRPEGRLEDAVTPRPRQDEQDHLGDVVGGHHPGQRVGRAAPAGIEREVG